MEHHAGIDVSLEDSSFCVVDGAGKIVREAKIASDPEALIGWFAALGLDLMRIGLEAGPVSQWLYAKMKEAGLAVELLETRHVKTALQTMPVKTDRNDVRGIAQLMRLGWFRPVHCKSMAAQETRALLTARKLVQPKLYDIEMSLRGFGLKVGPTTPKRFVAAHRGTRCRACDLGSPREGAAFGACGFAARVRHVRKARAGDGAKRQARQADDVGTGRRRDRGADLMSRRSTIRRGFRPRSGSERILA